MGSVGRAMRHLHYMHARIQCNSSPLCNPRLPPSTAALHLPRPTCESYSQHGIRHWLHCGAASQARHRSCHSHQTGQQALLCISGRPQVQEIGRQQGHGRCAQRRLGRCSCRLNVVPQRCCCRRRLPASGSRRTCNVSSRKSLELGLRYLQSDAAGAGGNQAAHPALMISMAQPRALTRRPQHALNHGVKLIIRLRVCRQQNVVLAEEGLHGRGHLGAAVWCHALGQSAVMQAI